MEQKEKSERHPLEILKRAKEAGELNGLPPEFLEALENGQIELPTSDPSPEETLATDGEASLYVGDNHFPKGFMLTLVNGGGFSGVMVSYEGWEEMKVKVDNFIKRKKEAQDAQAHAGPRHATGPCL